MSRSKKYTIYLEVKGKYKVAENGKTRASELYRTVLE